MSFSSSCAMISWSKNRIRRQTACLRRRGFMITRHSISDRMENGICPYLIRQAADSLFKQPVMTAEGGANGI